MEKEQFKLKSNALKRKLLDNAKEVQQINEKGRAALKDFEQQNVFKGSFKVLEKYFSRFENLWDELVDIYDGEDKSSEFPTNTDTTLQSNTKRYYFEALSTYETLQASATNSRQSFGPNDTTSSETRFNKNLPKLNLPHFNGQLTNWPKFRDAFTSIIHNDSFLSKMEKFHYLISSISGPASAVISTLPLIEDNYDLAWKVLNDTFNNKRMLASSYLNQLLGFQPQQGNATIDSLQYFLSHISDSIAAFKLLNIPDEADFILFHTAVRLLDPATREQFELQQKGKEFPIFSDLTTFLRERCLALQLANGSSFTTDLEVNTKNTISKHSHNFKVSSRTSKTSLLTSNEPLSLKNRSEQSVYTPSCFICLKGAHPLYQCKTFTNLSVKDRHEKLKTWKGCKNCLSASHATSKCQSKWNCKFCHRRHNSLLHFPTATAHIENSNEAEIKQKEYDVKESTSSTLTATVPQQNNILLGTVVAEIQDAFGNFQTIRLVVDSGSQHSFITNNCLSKLGLQSSRFQQRISAIGQTAFDGAKGKALCFLKPKNASSPVLSTEAIVINNITSHLPNFTMPSSVWLKYINFDLADPKFYEPGPVDFLLGSDLFPDIWNGSFITVQDNMPKLFSSIFGYIAIGKVHEPCSITRSRASFFTIQEEDCLHQQLQRFWELEEPPKGHVKTSPEDTSCEEHFKATHYRLDDGQYVVRLPFKESEPKLGDSSLSSLKRFQSLEKKLDKTPDLKLEYSKFMKEYLDLGHMSPTSSNSKYIIPHHSVVKEDRNKIKLRVVFDASAQTSNALGSLNNHLLAGPKLQQDIKDILLRFRLHPVVFVADIVKMYRQILVDPRDREFQHIFWRFDGAESVKKYQLNTVTYGTSSAPFLALRVLKQLEIDEGTNFPQAAAVISKDMYVDDLVTGASSVKAALKLQQEVINIMEKGHFTLSKWASNNTEIMQAVQTEGKTNIVSLTSSEDPSIKILGLQWNPSSDSFFYKIEDYSPVFTKRAILSAVAKVFDPLGFLAPIILTAKNVIQDLWKLKINWDSEIPSHLKQLWKKFVHELAALTSLNIPRFITSNTPYKFQIIGFSDASSKGYCATVYLRVISDKITTHLLIAKTKLAPVKTSSIPRLELCGAYLLAQLCNSVQVFLSQSNNVPEKIILFTDATIVLGWINTPSYKLKTFVANRVAHITELTPQNCWRHVKSEDNPSDHGSRGLFPTQLLICDLWWKGPKWLCLPEEKWPQSTPICFQELPEVKTEPQVLVSTNDEPFIIQVMSRHSCYYKLISAIAWIKRFAYNLQAKKENLERVIGPLQSSEIQQALIFCCKQVQQHHFFENNKMKTKLILDSKFDKLSPFVDELGVVRVGGRLRNALIPVGQKHPILLPKCHFTNLIIEHYHKKYLHPGPNHLQALVQQWFWIPSLRSLVRYIYFKCIKCYKGKAKTFSPKMADLPAPRVNQSKAFLHTGVDFAGPLVVKESLRRKAQTYKVYICLFVCLATKALHLELVTALTTEAFLAAFHRFISRRGLPEQMYSDCGTNFQGANNRLKDFAKWYTKHSTQEDISYHFTKLEVKWNFNPPYSPHFGGIWEAGVKSAKSVLRKVIGETILTYEELSTLLTKVEAVLNSRPLCPLSASPDENNFLSPGHFLVGGPILTPPEPSVLSCRDAGLSRWEHVQKMIQHFWKRWRLEYLSTLQKRGKWLKTSTDPKVGDLVFIKDDHVPVLQWPLGRIIKLHPGQDGVSRVMTVKSKDSEIKRPAIKLVPLLPVNNQI